MGMANIRNYLIGDIFIYFMARSAGRRAQGKGHRAQGTGQRAIEFTIDE
jgi:hypothetical protein